MLGQAAQASSFFSEGSPRVGANGQDTFHAENYGRRSHICLRSYTKDCIYIVNATAGKGICLSGRLPSSRSVDS